MMKKSVVKLIIFSSLGALVGWSYYFFIGCKTNSCPITSNPYISIFYGLLIGFILGFDAKIFKTKSTKTNE